MGGAARSRGGRRCAACALAAVAAAGALVPEDTCVAGSFFDGAAQQCTSCRDLDEQAVLDADRGRCTCAAGLVECRGGQWCWIGNPSSAEPFKATRSLECHACEPDAEGNASAPTEDRTGCLPCADGETLGFSEETKDCLCPAGHALVERSEDGRYLAAKRCVQCADGTLPGPAGQDLSVYHCSPCPDPHRMIRDPGTGDCKCNADSYATGGTCIDIVDYDEINDRHPAISAVEVTFRDLIDDREEFWQYGPFGTHLGLEERYDDIMEVLSVDGIGSTIQVTSAMFKWLYMRCAVGCEDGNETACQCISNLCVLQLYEDTATVCTVLTDFLYSGRETVDGYLGWRVGMPWLFYAPATADQTLYDTSLQWKFVLQDEVEDAGSTNTLSFWLGSYSLEGEWLGWSELGSQLNLCLELGGTSQRPQAAPSAWTRFGGSLTTECSVGLDQLELCGESPLFHDLFVENVDGSLVPVPVRILNLMQGQKRPNLNRIPEDLGDDVFVRRFTLCDSLTGREGGPEVYQDPRGYSPVAFRWAAHMAVQVRLRPDSDGQIYVPVLSIAYADKREAGTGDGPVAPVSFKVEYSMETGSYWTVVVVLFSIMLVVMVAVAAFRVYMISLRYPTMPAVMAAGDPQIFVPKAVLIGHVLTATCFSLLFWFHFSQAMYWYVLFKAQSVPHVLLPSAFEGDQYEPHDVLIILGFLLGFATVALGLFRQLKVFIFLVDWERGRQQPELPPGSPPHQAPEYMQQRPGGALGPGPCGQRPPAEHMPQAVGAPLLAPSGGQPPRAPLDAPPPDQGVSAWRSIFICNELNERLVSTSTSSFVTWLVMVGLLEGAGLKNGARWYPRFSGDEAMMTAQYNPFLQFGLSGFIWILTLLAQLLVRRVASIFIGDDLIDFIDLCSVSNVSVVLMDEPFHGYYIHGRAPSNNSDVCHTDLARALAREGKGIGFGRGLTADDCQTFEMFLPPELGVQGPTSAVNFRRELLRIFSDVRTTDAEVAQRRPARPTEADIAEMSRHRCSVQALIDSFVHAVIRNVDEVVRYRSSMDAFLGMPPKGGVAALRSPVFFRDQDGPSFPNGVGWSSCLAHGAEVRFMGVGLPTGFEWNMLLLEFMLFSVVWRFYGSIYLASALGFVLNRLVMAVYGEAGKAQLAHTSIINPMFLI